MAGHHQPPARTLRAQGDLALDVEAWVTAVALETTVTAGLEGFQNKNSVYSCENQDPRVHISLLCPSVSRERVDS